MKALVGAFNQEKALVRAFSVIVQPVVEPMDRFTALHFTLTRWPLCYIADKVDMSRSSGQASDSSSDSSSSSSSSESESEDSGQESLSAKKRKHWDEPRGGGTRPQCFTFLACDVIMPLLETRSQEIPLLQVNSMFNFNNHLLYVNCLHLPKFVS